MSLIEELQEWYLSQCDDDWEHTYGIEIGNLDNPGWSFKVDLVETDLENMPFIEYSYGIDDQSITNGNNWLICKKDGYKFVAYGGPHKLQEMIKIFLDWAKSNA